MWQNKRKRSGPTFPELLWILRSFFKVALGSLWITKRLFVKLMLPRAVAKKNGRSCRVWIFCVSCVHEDALCTLMIYHGGLMCHQTFNSFAQKIIKIFIQMYTQNVFQYVLWFALKIVVSNPSWNLTIFWELKFRFANLLRLKIGLDLFEKSHNHPFSYLISSLEFPN